MTTSQWRYYLPDDETIDDATEMSTAWDSFFVAAEEACEHHYNERDGWERGSTEEFPIIVVAPDGTERAFLGRHEPSVEHYVREAKEQRP